MLSPFSRWAPGARTVSRQAHTETLLLACCLWWVLVCNGPFFAAMLAGRSWNDPSAWGFTAALGLGLTALHGLILAPLLLTHHVARGVLALLLVSAGVSGFFMSHLGVFMDPSMLRNTLRTDVHEARELFSWAMVPKLLLYTGLPLLLLSRWRARPVSLGRALLRRVLFMVLMAVVAVGMTLAIYGPLASLMRNQKELRYLINPAAPLWSLAQALRDERKDAKTPLQAIGTDAAPGALAAARAEKRAKPLVVVLVVGETARAANWGLNGYGRATTPEMSRLAAAPELPLINVPEVRSCGTNTEVSLPCMFAPVGRRDYDERRIRSSQSLLHVAARAGVGVLWRDNQSGCKGVCDGLPQQDMAQLNPPGLCQDGRCVDDALLHGLPDLLGAAKGTQLLVLHMLGSHGPSYHRRVPAALARFQPACNVDDLRQCSVEQIVNAYDNTLLYTDAVLGRLVAQLQAREQQVNSLMLYVSDHGESLGEKGLYLHGIPYAIAPDVQTRVPMVLWASAGAPQAMGLEWGCLQRRAAASPTQPVTHDHLFHTLLSMLDVRTALHAADWDLTTGCRSVPVRP